jgi:hypothetical protein
VAAASASAAWDVEEAARLPPLALPTEWQTVHAMRRARALVLDSVAAGRATLAASIARYRELEDELSRQRASGGAAPGEVARRGPVANAVSCSWDGTLFAHVLVESTARKCLLRAALLALALSAGSARLRRSLVAQIAHPPNLALARIVFAVREPPRRLAEPPRRLAEPPRRLAEPPRRLAEATAAGALLSRPDRCMPARVSTLPSSISSHAFPTYPHLFSRVRLRVFSLAPSRRRVPPAGLCPSDAALPCGSRPRGRGR